MLKRVILTKKKRFARVQLSVNGLVLAAMARDKFIIENGDGEYAPLNFTIFRKEPFKTFLLKSDLYKMRNMNEQTP
jgi:hypothetical protein